MPVQDRTIVLGEPIGLEELEAVARYGAAVEFSEQYRRRVGNARILVEKWVDESRVMYGVTTGFGVLCNQTIPLEETVRLQRNIVLSHATSVGEPFTEEQARASMLMVLQNLGQGYSGVRLDVLETYRSLLNRHITPWMPREGSVGYLSPEAHMALVAIGEGKAYAGGRLLCARDALAQAGITPIELHAKEGLALVSGTTTTTALAALALADLLNAAKSADIVAAITLEVCGGQIRAYDQRAMQVRPHPRQSETADNVRRILAGSQMLADSGGPRVQDALSLRCVPQLHGAAKKTLLDARQAIETEINSCCDNPIIWTGAGEEAVYSAGNADSSYVGIEMDSACIAATALAKMSERRNNHMIDSNLSGNPWFLAKDPGLNSGLMIPQYTQAGLLGDMRMLSTPSTIDNTPTCGNQEDYVAMGYNAAKKSIQIAEKLEYILAIELLSAYAAQAYTAPGRARAAATNRVLAEIQKHVPPLEQDTYLHPYIEALRELIHSRKLVAVVEQTIGALQ